MCGFFPSIINKYLGRSESAVLEKVSFMDNITKDITGGEVNVWLDKDLLSCGSLSVKYAILNMIGATNWTHSNHTSGITTGLAKMIFLIGIMAKLDFVEYVFFYQTMKQAETYGVKLPFAFRSLITEIILS